MDNKSGRRPRAEFAPERGYGPVRFLQQPATFE